MKVSLRFLASLAGTLILTGIALAQVPTQPPAQSPAARVNGEPIMHSEVQAVIKMSQPPSPTPTPVNEAQAKEMYSNALNLLIEDMLMRQYLRKNAPPASAQDLDKEVQELTAALAKDSKQTLPQFLAATGQTEAQMRADIAARLQWKSFITPRLTDAAVKQYYETNKVFFDKVLVRASHVLIKIDPNATQQDKQEKYNRIVTIRQDILTGKIKFEEAAKKYSDCPSKDNGGDIGLFPFKFAVLEPFARAAFSMKIGDMSEVVVTDFGYHVLKVTDRTNGQPSNFESLKSEVKEIYAQECYQYIIGEQRKAAKIER